jgi:hypothetical protein
VQIGDGRDGAQCPRADLAIRHARQGLHEWLDRVMEIEQQV